MRFGICVGLSTENVRIAADCGYDYVESNFGGIANASEEDFAAFKNALEEIGIPCESANCFMPNALHPVGDSVDYDVIKAYVEKGMTRCEAIGIKTVVFGSGRSRAVPDGFSFGEAFRQLVYFLGEVVSPIAAAHGITVVTEPLRRNESNIINTGCEGVMLAAMADKPNIKSLVDLFHMGFCGDTIDTVKLLRGWVKHAHIANPAQEGDSARAFPKSADEVDYKGFIDALVFAGCERCSVEAHTDDFAADAPLSAKLLRPYFE